MVFPRCSSVLSLLSLDPSIYIHHRSVRNHVERSSEFMHIYEFLGRNGLIGWPRVGYKTKYYSYSRNKYQTKVTI